MIDIIERLRQRARPLEKRLSEKNTVMRDFDLRVSYDDLITEAAEEIDRLRAEVARLTKIIDDAWGEA